MEKSSTLERLRALEADLRERGIGSLFLFGSIARNEGAAGSDVDLFFDAAQGARLSLLDVIGVRQFLQDALASNVDLLDRKSLHPLLREDIEAEAVPVF